MPRKNVFPTKNLRLEGPVAKAMKSGFLRRAEIRTLPDSNHSIPFGCSCGSSLERLERGRFMTKVRSSNYGNVYIFRIELTALRRREAGDNTGTGSD